MSWFSVFLTTLKKLVTPVSKKTESKAPIFFTNTLSGKKEVFIPLRAGSATLYSCGPTVYSKQHIGNMRAWIFSDVLARTLMTAGYHVRRVINITDVGHLVSDADEGEDKMEVGSKREGLSAQEVAARYTKLFLDDLALLNLNLDEIQFPRASEYVPEQIHMIEALEKGGHTYRTHDGIYFDTATFADYGKLGGVDVSQNREYVIADIGRRITENKEKKHPADFALWRFSPVGEQRQQEWQSPWGRGFPGWHIECSAMSKALLGTQIDIHTGGMDHIPVHHNNEIAQSESISHKNFARYWVHEAFLTIEGRKISKSAGDDIYVSDLIEQGLSPLALRYFFLQGHYRTPLSFSWDAVTAAHEALLRLTRLVSSIVAEAKGIEIPSEESRTMIALLRDDLATPAALAYLWEIVRDEDMVPSKKLGVISVADAVLGLSLMKKESGANVVPEDIQTLLAEREEARAARDFARADELRIHIENSGYSVDDTKDGAQVKKKFPPIPARESRT